MEGKKQTIITKKIRTYVNAQEIEISRFRQTKRTLKTISTDFINKKEITIITSFIFNPSASGEQPIDVFTKNKISHNTITRASRAKVTIIEKT